MFENLRVLRILRGIEPKAQGRGPDPPRQGPRRGSAAEAAGSCWAPFGTQDGSKTALFCHRFFNAFLNRFCIDFPTQLGANLASKIDAKRLPQIEIDF